MDLDRELRALAVDWPETPDLAAAVRPRLAPRPRPWWRVVAALAVAAVAGTMLVPDARSAIFEWLGITSAKIERRAPEPVRSFGIELDLGEAATVGAANARAGFRAAPPSPPDGVFFSDGPPPRVSYVYGRAGRPEVFVMVAQAQASPFLGKTVGPGTTLEEFEIDGAPAFFLSGAPHGVAFGTAGNNLYFDEQRLAGNTLLVERDGFLIRVEGDVTRERAAALARRTTATAR